MYHDKDVGTEMCSALNQLTRLHTLSLYGYKEGGCAATVHLQLPKLVWFTLTAFWSTTILLNCPQLKTLMLSNLEPLQEVSGLSDGIKALVL